MSVTWRSRRPYKPGSAQGTWVTTDHYAGCQECAWHNRGYMTHTVTAAVRRHVLATGHTVQTTRTQRRLSGPPVTGY